MASMTEEGVDFVDRAPILIHNELHLRQSPAEVWRVLVDHARWPEWFEACKACHLTSEQKEGVGSTRFMHLDLFKVTERMIVWDEPSQWGFTIPEANMPIAKSVVELVTLRPNGDGTHLDYKFAIELKPWMRPFSKAFEWNMSRIFRRSLPGLQRQLDTIAASG